MAQQVSVKGDRVTIDHGAYDVKLVTAGKYKVLDEFGGHVGNFTLAGRAVEAEDFGVEGAHSIVQIGRAWVAEQQRRSAEQATPLSKMVCRVATHEQAAPADVERQRAYQAWARGQAGVRAAFVTWDTGSGRATSVTVADTREQLDALKGLEGAAGVTPLKASSVHVAPLVEGY
jgi:hypothetical protein